MNGAGYKMMKWTVEDPTAFQYHPYTMGWGVVLCSMISHRVTMQPVMHKKMEGFFWLNEEMYSSVQG